MNDETIRLQGDKKIPFGTLIKRMFSYSKGVRWMMALAFLFLIINVGIDVVLPLILEQIINDLDDEVIHNIAYSVILGFVIGYFLLSVINQAFRYGESMLLQKAGQKIVYQLRTEVFAHIEHMSQNQFNAMPVGALVTRVANYTASISNLFTDVAVNMFTNTLTVIVVFIIMMIKSWRLSLILLAFAALISVLTYFFAKKIGNQWRAQRKSTSDLNAFLSENLSGMRITQIYNQENKKEREFNAKNEKLRKDSYAVNVSFTFYRPVIAFLQYVATAVVFLMGFFLAFNAGEVVAFYLYLSKFFNPIQNLADQFNEIQNAATSCERLFNLLDVEPEAVDIPEAKTIDAFEGKIEFRHVWFAYEGENWILKDVSFTVNPKQTVAFVGATGAGKTTILSLIVRNYVPQKGEILIDGIDIRTIAIESLRKAVGQMLQDVFLFSGTIRDNITLHDETFSLNQIEGASHYVNADQFIEKLPKKYDEEVIERGENLSSGQRQLLSFARTVLHEPQILILDEATANIDTETEVLIQNSLEKMKSIGTMLVVAHRLSTIQHSDNIIVLQNGEIIEQGNHQALLAQKGYYYKLYQLQFEPTN